MECYKVVSLVTGKNNRIEYRSAIVTSSKYRMRYVIGEKAEPQIGKIYVFASYRKAKDFANRFRSKAVLLCECGELTESRTTGGETHNWRGIVRWWSTKKNGMATPDGSYLTDWVRPIKEMNTLDGTDAML